MHNIERNQSFSFFCGGWGTAKKGLGARPPLTPRLSTAPKKWIAIYLFLKNCRAGSYRSTAPTNLIFRRKMRPQCHFQFFFWPKMRFSMNISAENRVWRLNDCDFAIDLFIKTGRAGSYRSIAPKKWIVGRKMRPQCHFQIFFGQKCDFLWVFLQKIASDG